MTGYKSKRDAALDEEGMYLVHQTAQLKAAGLPDTPTARAYLKKVLDEDEDDDIQVYKRPWVGLTEQQRNDIENACEMIIGKPTFDAIEAKLKEKNT